MSTRRKYKTYKELSFTDDFLFCNIMQNNPDICKELVELLLDRKVGKVAYSETQKSIDLALEQKGVRLDVYFEDDLSTAYNIEMQTSNTGNLPKRSRYYQGTVDLNMISSGAGYDELKTSSGNGSFRSFFAFPFRDCRFYSTFGSWARLLAMSSSARIVSLMVPSLNYS